MVPCGESKRVEKQELVLLLAAEASRTQHWALNPVCETAETFAPGIPGIPSRPSTPDKPWWRTTTVSTISC